MEIQGCVCARVRVYFSRLSEATELDSESGRVWDPEPRQGQKEIAKRLTTPSPTPRSGCKAFSRFLAPVTQLKIEKSSYMVSH